MRFLGIDYGAKRVGIAISDEDCRFAFPKEIIENDQNILEKIAKLIQNENIRGLVVGESLNFSGTPNAIMGQVQAFTAKLKNRIEVPVHFEKEFLTTVEARRYEGQGKVDAQAAALILQRFLDRKNNLTGSK